MSLQAQLKARSVEAPLGLPESSGPRLEQDYRLGCSVAYFLTLLVRGLLIYCPFFPKGIYLFPWGSLSSLVSVCREGHREANEA